MGVETAISDSRFNIFAAWPRAAEGWIVRLSYYLCIARHSPQARWRCRNAL